MTEMEAAVVLTLKDKLTSAMRKVVGAVKQVKKELVGVGQAGRRNDMARQFSAAEIRARKLRMEMGRLKSSMTALKTHAAKTFGRAGLIGAVLGGGKAAMLAAGMPMVKTAADFEKYSMMLKNATTSKKEFDAAQAFIFKYESQTPFNLEEVTRAYIRLRQQGIDPTAGAMQAAGNAAASNGVDLLDAVDAVLDARTKEFERLKAFGITTSSDKGKATFSYTNKDGDGKTVTANLQSQKELSEAILKIWAEKFGGATDDLAKGWGGIMSSLESMRSKFELMVMESGPFMRFKGMLQGLLDQLVKWEADGTMRRFAETFARSINDTFDKLIPLARGVWDGLTKVAEVVDKLAQVAGGYQNLGKIAVALWLMVPALKLLGAAKGAVTTLAAIAALNGTTGAALLGVAGGLLAIGAALAVIDSQEPKWLDWLAQQRPGENKGKAFAFPDDQFMMVGQKTAAAAGQVVREMFQEFRRSWDAEGAKLEAYLRDVGARWMTSLWEGMKSIAQQIGDWVASWGASIGSVFDSIGQGIRDATGLGAAPAPSAPASGPKPGPQLPRINVSPPADRANPKHSALTGNRTVNIAAINVNGVGSKREARSYGDEIAKRISAGLHDGAYVT
jgi:hypothetical protein